MSDGCGHCCTEIENISVSLGKNKILDQIHFHLHCGQLTVLVGPNGAGKTTLIRALLNEVPFTGDIKFTSIHNNRKPGRLNIGYVPQKIEIDNNSPISVYDLFASAVSRLPSFLWKSSGLEKKITEYLSEFEAGKLIKKRLCELSGGELQRVMLCLAVTPQPELLLLDEPVSGIDRNGLDIFYSKLEELKHNRDMAILLVSHDLNYVSRYADRIVLLNKRILADGEPKDVMESPEFKEVFTSWI